MLRMYSEDNSLPLANNELNQIFIGREQEQAHFKACLRTWQQLIFDDEAEDTQVLTTPSPNNRFQGLVTLLYGRGGFGKSTLLHRFHEIIQNQNQNPLISTLQTSNVIDWEFAIEEERAFFNIPESQEIDAAAYFKMLCGQLAQALNKQPKDFSEYQTAAKDVERVKRKANGILDNMQKDDRYAWLRGLTVEGVTAAIRTSLPASRVVLDNPTVKSAINEAAKITQEQAVQVHAKLRDKLGTQFADYLNPTLRLGLALGHDLSKFSLNFPLVIFFDTYEEIDEGDRLLRIVMGAAGLRVGWIIAGRDNLWAGWDQRERSIAMEYGYKDIVHFDRSLAINFNEGGVGTFTPWDITNYFAQVYQRVRYNPPLPTISEEDIGKIYKITKGVPLAIYIAAVMYIENADVSILTEEHTKNQDIVDTMIQRYLLHTRADQIERNHLYGLALLRRPDQPLAIAAALGLPQEAANASYTSELSRLHRRYSFIFAEENRPSLHQEVRYFLRLWLLKRYTQPEIIEVNKHLREAHLNSLVNLESTRQYTNIKERLEDEQWVGIYLDLVEQQFWLDPVIGVAYALPFMYIASIYRRKANREIAGIGNFFETLLVQPYRRHWEWAIQGLIYNTSYDPTSKELSALEQLEKWTQEKSLGFPSPLLQGKTYQEEIKGALWWRLGEAYRGKDDQRALEWYEKALDQLGVDNELSNEGANTAINIAYKLYKEKKYSEGLPWLDKALELRPNYIDAYSFRGIGHDYLKDYQQALTDYSQALALGSTSSSSYNNRGVVYAKLKEYQQALADFTQAITLDSTEASYYSNRGNTYKDLKEYQLALTDFNQTILLDPTNANYYNNRGTTYRDLKEYQLALTDYNQAILLDPTEARYYNNRGTTHRNLKEYQLALTNYNQAKTLDPTNASYCNNRGTAHRDLKEYQLALTDYNQAIILDPTEARYYQNRGNAYRDLKEYQLALTDFNQVIALDPINADYYDNRGAAYRDLKEYQLALTDYNQAIILDPTHANYYDNRGATYEDLKEYQLALTDFNQAIALDPTNADYYNNRGTVYRDLKEYKLALTDYNRASILDPTHAGYYNNQGAAYRDLKEYQLALTNFNQAIALDPTHADYYNNRGAAYRDLKEYQLALTDYNQAIILDPAHANYYGNRGATYGDLKEYDKALVDFDRAIELNKDEKRDWLISKGLVFSYIGQYNNAIKSYEESLQLKNDNYVSLYNIAVVMIRWKGFFQAQQYIDAARNAFLKERSTDTEADILYGYGGLEALAGNNSQALYYLRRAILCDKRVIEWAYNDIAWSDLRNDVEFQRLIGGNNIGQPKQRSKRTRKTKHRRY